MPRVNQKNRTRKDLLNATACLIKQNSVTLTLEAIAKEARVSRATAYRYFPSVESAVVEACLDGDTPTAEDLFAHPSSSDPIARVLQVDQAFQRMIAANEKSLRVMMIHSLQQTLKEPRVDIPIRQNRRAPLIEEALKPIRGKIDAARVRTLVAALSMIIGTESMLVCKDVLRLKDSEAKRAKEFAIRALIEAALSDRLNRAQMR